MAPRARVTYLDGVGPLTGVATRPRQLLQALGIRWIDVGATVVRMVLVPAVMELLGTANWWLPRPLARILPPASPRGGEPLAAARTLVSATDAQQGG